MDYFTWWGASGVEIEVGGRRLLIDPYRTPEHLEAHYVLVSRENYDHCDESAIERLIGRKGFERLLVPRSCLHMSRLDTPAARRARDLRFVDPELMRVMHPKFGRKGSVSAKPDGEGEAQLDGFQITVFESSESEPLEVLGAEFAGKRYRPSDGTPWPATTGNWVGGGLFPALGYVAAAPEGPTFFHPGRIQEAFDSHRMLRGKIDYLFLPLASLLGSEITFVNNIRPRFVVPIQYRPDDPAFPIPLNIDAASLTTTDLHLGRPGSWADPRVYREEVGKMMEANWYATPADPSKRIAEITPALEALGSKVLVANASKRQELKH